MSTTTVTLTDRYVLAVTGSVPQKQRQEVGDELRTLIADQVDALTEAGEPHSLAEERVLSELGDPEKLAAGYADRPLHLIGPRFYLPWLHLQKLLLCIVPPLAGAGVVIGQLVSGADIGEVIWTAVSTVLSVIVGITFWVTLVFAILERTGMPEGDADISPWTLEDLPAPGDTGAGIGEMVASITFAALMAVAVVWDHVHGAALIDGEWMSVLNPALWPAWAIGLGVLLLLDAIVAVLVFRHRGCTFGLATLNAVLAAAFAAPAVWLISTERLINPALKTAVTDVLGGDAETVLPVLATALVASIVLISGWDAIDGFLKARRAARVR